MEEMKKINKIAKPFIKWAGGKAQLLNEIDDAILYHIKQDRFTYIESFVGGGAVLSGFCKNAIMLKKL